MSLLNELKRRNVFKVGAAYLALAWLVLRHSYRFERDRIAWFFRRLFEPWNTVFEHAQHVATALEWYEAGCDFADALHLAACETATMHTFDRRFCKPARDLGTAPEVRVWET